MTFRTSGLFGEAGQLLGLFSGGGLETRQYVDV